MPKYKNPIPTSNRGLAFNTIPKWPLAKLTGICNTRTDKRSQHATAKRKPRKGDTCGTTLTLYTWTGNEGVVKCRNCGEPGRVRA